MFERYAWEPLTGAERDAMLQLINPIKGRHTATAATVDAASCALPFYPAARLMRVDDRSWPFDTGPFWFLVAPRRVFMLDGASAPIHDVNELEPITVTEANVLDYLRFFTYFVHGEEGPFLVVDDIGDPLIEQLDLNPTMRASIADAITPPVFHGRGPDGDLEASATILYGDGLFSARFSVSRSGMIEMIDEDSIAADLRSAPIARLPN